MHKLVLIGGGGHCKSCIDVIESAGNFEIAGILDKNRHDAVCGYPVLGGDEKISELSDKGFYFLITVGQVKTAGIRKNIYENLIAANAKLATVISSAAYVSRHAVIGAGSIIMHQCVINAGVVIGENNIINTGAVIEHDSITGNHCHVSTAAVINGDCRIGNEVFIGSNSVLNNGIVISDQVIVGSGTTIHRSVTAPGVYASSSFRQIR